MTGTETSWWRAQFAGFWSLSPHRLVDETECVCSVLLAILLAHAIGAHYIAWAAFSGYMVMRGRVAESLVRGGLRIAGTIAGAALALLVVPLVTGSAVAQAIAATLIGGATLYGALTGKRAYAWLFVGLTFEMVLFEVLAQPHLPIRTFAETRVLEVLAGTAACVTVSALSALTARRRWPAPARPTDYRRGWHPHAALHVGQAMVALLVLVPLWHLFAIPQLAQSAVTIMAVMLLPLGSIDGRGFRPVSRRMVFRISGCLAGSLLAAAVLFAAQGQPLILIAGTAIGVAIGRHIENGVAGIAYVGTQFTLAVLVTLVPDSYAAVDLAPAVERLCGILLGMVILEPVLLGSLLITPPRAAGAAPTK